MENPYLTSSEREQLAALHGYLEGKAYGHAEENKIDWQAVGWTELLAKMKSALDVVPHSFKPLSDADRKKRYYQAVCSSCGWWGSSGLLTGGGAIADTGCHNECRCPMCNSWEIEEFLHSAEKTEIPVNLSSLDATMLHMSHDVKAKVRQYAKDKPGIRWALPSLEWEAGRFSFVLHLQECDGKQPNAVDLDRFRTDTLFPEQKVEMVIPAKEVTAANGSVLSLLKDPHREDNWQVGMMREMPERPTVLPCHYEWRDGIQYVAFGISGAGLDGLRELLKP